jgi:ABC-type phosphate transport system substrate-binding protein
VLCVHEPCFHTCSTAHAQVDFGVGVGPLSSPSLPGGTINLPIAWHTVSIYINMLGGTRTLNLTACLAAKIFSGATTKW